MSRVLNFYFLEFLFHSNEILCFQYFNQTTRACRKKRKVRLQYGKWLKTAWVTVRLLEREHWCNSKIPNFLFNCCTNNVDVEKKYRSKNYFVHIINYAPHYFLTQSAWNYGRIFLHVFSIHYHKITKGFYRNLYRPWYQKLQNFISLVITSYSNSGKKLSRRRNVKNRIWK